jgi:hypothetical protein
MRVDMPALVLIPPMPKSEINELTEEERTPILRYIIPLHRVISDLLESNDNEFEYNFERTKTQFLIFSNLVIMTLGENHCITLMKKHLEFSLQQRRPQSNNPVVQALFNANEIILDFFKHVSDTEYKEFLPEYPDAFVPLLNPIIYCTVLMFIAENKSKSRNISRIVQGCEGILGTLEGWVSTIEIETGPAASHTRACKADTIVNGLEYSRTSRVQENDSACSRAYTTRSCDPESIDDRESLHKWCG